MDHKRNWDITITESARRRTREVHFLGSRELVQRSEGADCTIHRPGREIGTGLPSWTWSRSCIQHSNSNGPSATWSVGRPTFSACKGFFPDGHGWLMRQTTGSSVIFYYSKLFSFRRIQTLIVNFVQLYSTQLCHRLIPLSFIVLLWFSLLPDT